MYSLKLNQSQFKSCPDCNKDGTQAFSSNYELQRLTKLNIFIITSLKFQQFTSLTMVRMAQVVEWIDGIIKVWGSLLTSHIMELCVALFNYADCDE